MSGAPTAFLCSKNLLLDAQPSPNNITKFTNVQIEVGRPPPSKDQAADLASSGDQAFQKKNPALVKQVLIDIFYYTTTACSYDLSHATSLTAKQIDYEELIRWKLSLDDVKNSFVFSVHPKTKRLLLLLAKNEVHTALIPHFQEEDVEIYPWHYSDPR